MTTVKHLHIPYRPHHRCVEVAVTTGVSHSINTGAGLQTHVTNSWWEKESRKEQKRARFWNSKNEAFPLSFLRFLHHGELFMSNTWYPQIKLICWFEKTFLDWAEITGSGLISKQSHTETGIAAQNRCPQTAFHPLIADGWVYPFWQMIVLKSYFWWA